MNLLEAARPLAERFTALPSPTLTHIVAHYDADGIASAAVAVRALTRLGRPFHVQFTWDHKVPDMETAPGDAWWFLDLGATFLPTLAALPGSVFVFDHHPVPPPLPTAPRLFHLNPHLLGLDGSTACGSTTTLAFAVALSEQNWDLAPLALAGAYGDRQERGGFQGWNAQLLQEAQRRGHVAEAIRLHLEDAPLVDILAHPRPPLDGLLAPSSPAAQDFLATHDLPPKATVHELDPKELERLASALALAHLRAGKPATDLPRLFGPLPTSPAHGGLPILRLMSLIDAAAREGEASLGLAFLLGDESARAELETLEARFHHKIRTAVEVLLQTPPVERKTFRVFPVDDVAYVGTLSGLAMDKLLPPDKPTLAYAVVHGQARISARATPDLLNKGVDLSRALAAAAAEFDGQGGGHPIASGATIPAGYLTAFLDRLETLLETQRLEEAR